MAHNTLTDTSGNYPADYNQTVVEKFRPMLQTGQTATYAQFDDGNTTRGVTRSYTDNGDGTIKDNATGLLWQKEDDNTQRNWVDAKTYCSSLNLGGFSSGWYLPSIDELVGITDKGRSNPAIDPLFANTNSFYYWSSTTYASYPSSAWDVFFGNGYDNGSDKTYSGYVRCVR